MATQATLSAEEQGEIYHSQTFSLARNMGIEWIALLGDHAPFAMTAAIDAFGQMLVPLIGGEATAKLLDELARTLREMDDNPEPAQ